MGRPCPASEQRHVTTVADRQLLHARPCDASQGRVASYSI